MKKNNEIKRNNYMTNCQRKYGGLEDGPRDPQVVVSV